MKKYGIFSGWFSLEGKRGRISFLFSSIFVYITSVIIIYLAFILGIPSFFILALSGNDALISSSKLLFFVPIALTFLLIFWSLTCIEIQRLRDIGFNSLFIILTILITYFLQIIGILTVQNIYSDESNFHWTNYLLLLIGLFLLFMPPASKDDGLQVKSKNNSSEKKSQYTITNKKIDPTL